MQLSAALLSASESSFAPVWLLVRDTHTPSLWNQLWTGGGQHICSSAPETSPTEWHSFHTGSQGSTAGFADTLVELSCGTPHEDSKAKVYVPSCGVLILCGSRESKTPGSTLQKMYCFFYFAKNEMVPLPRPELAYLSMQTQGCN